MKILHYTVFNFHSISDILPSSSICAFICLQIEAGLGLSEGFYHVAMLALNVGELFGAFIGSIGRIPLWYSTMAGLLCHITGFVVYGLATSGWMMIVAQVLSGIFVGMQSVPSLAYFGVSYQHYLEVLGPEERTKEEGKTTRVKDMLFVFYSVSANIGTLIGPGLITRHMFLFLFSIEHQYLHLCALPL